MSDPWSRPTDEKAVPPPDDVIEIELDGPSGAETPSATAPPTYQPNWRKIVAVSSVAGVALGLIAAAIIVTDDDSGEDPPRPGGEESEESAITTPDTLPPVVVDTTVASPVISGRPDLPLELPTYQDAAMPADILDNFVLDADLIAASPADRVEIQTTTEDGLGPTSAVIEYDAANDRYLATFDQRGPTQRLLIDAADETLYFMERARDSGEWQVIAGDNAAESAAEIYRSLLLSPIRPDTLASAATSAETGVILDSGVVARRYRVALPSVAIPEWTAGDDNRAPPGASHVFEAYVDESGRLAVVQGTVVVDGNRQMIVYRFDHNADVTVDLPEIESAAAEVGRRITEGA